MKLTGELQLKTTQQKLAKLEALINKKEASPSRSRLHQMSLNSMKRLATELRSETEE
jgi:hypothetical protein